MIFNSDSADMTMRIACDLASSLSGGEVVLLNGDLGAGKTTFTKGLAQGLGSVENVVSPTFTIMREYRDGRLPLFHFDMYRLSSEDELYELGLEEYLYGEGVCVIEWNKFTNLPKRLITVNIENLGGDNRRVEICEF